MTRLTLSLGVLAGARVAQLPAQTLSDTLQLHVPLPSGFERWRDLYLAGFSQKVLVFVALALSFYVVTRLARQQVDRYIEDVNRRHLLRKSISYGYALLLVLALLALFADALTSFGAVLALLAAGVAVALQDVLKSVVGWLYLSTRSGITVGSRIEVGGVRGDVIDVGVLKTTLLEVGNLVYADQSTGRIVTVPNWKMLGEGVFIVSGESPIVWTELRVRLSFASDWQRAEALLREIGEELHAQSAAEVRHAFRPLEQRYAFKYTARTPIVYVALGELGIELTLRFLSPVRSQRGGIDFVSRRVLQRLAGEPGIELAYPPVRVFRAGEPGLAAARPHDA